MSNTATIGDLLELLHRLKAANIHYVMSDHTEGAVMIEVAVPGERWEIELHEDGQIGVETFASVRGVGGPELLDRLFEQFGESDRDATANQS